MKLLFIDDSGKGNDKKYYIQGLLIDETLYFRMKYNIDNILLSLKKAHKGYKKKSPLKKMLESSLDEAKSKYYFKFKRKKLRRLHTIYEEQINECSSLFKWESIELNNKNRTDKYIEGINKLIEWTGVNQEDLKVYIDEKDSKDVTEGILSKVRKEYPAIKIEASKSFKEAGIQCADLLTILRVNS